MRLGCLVVPARSHYGGRRGRCEALAPSLLPLRHADPGLRSLDLSMARRVAGPVYGLPA